MEARTCSVEGCARQVRAQGLCWRHHQDLITSDPSQRVMVKNRAAVLAAMPARNFTILKKTGLHPQTVVRILAELRAEDKAHIGHFIPPVRPGDKFWPVFVAGPGVDAVLTEQMRRDQTNLTIRRGYHRRKAQAAGASWARALFFGGKR